MDLITTAPATRAMLAVSLCALLSACFGGSQQVRVVDPNESTQVNDRFDQNGLSDSYTAVVPRDFINLKPEDLNQDAPDAYTVVKGDTLWDISDRFLKKPWLWPSLWNYNPQIANPHLIYPGDKLALEYINGQPTLILSRNGKIVPRGRASGEPSLGAALPVGANGGAVAANTEKLSPQIRVESLDDAVPMIAGDTIQQFLVHPRVVDNSTLENAPYIVGNYDHRLISAVGHQVYARGIVSRTQTRFGIFRRNKALRDPVTNEMLGFEVTHVADAKLLNLGDPSTLGITSNKMETISGDVLLPINDDVVAHAYTPRLPEIHGEGRIISLVNAISQTGRNQVVVLNLGDRTGVKVGDVLAIETRGRSMIDSRGRGDYERLKMPNTRTGVVMVFRTFDKVSYALVMESTRPVMMNDIVTGI
ncbi:MAG: LysM peptidoglycan-binding domain-containing protein [Granulosicoccus sp.]